MGLVVDKSETGFCDVGDGRRYRGDEVSTDQGQFVLTSKIYSHRCLAALAHPGGFPWMLYCLIGEVGDCGCYCS